MPTDRPTDSTSDNRDHTGSADQDAVMNSAVLSSSKHGSVESGRLSASPIDTHMTGSTVINLVSTEVDAVWQSHRLPGVLRFYWDGTSTACLKLQFPINISATSPFPPKIPLYFLISPERIERVSLRPTSDVDVCGSETQTLDFVLSKPSFLVVPNVAWEPRDDISKQTRDLLYNLAAQTHITLCGKFSSAGNVRQFCTAASGGRIASSEHAQPVRLYRGENRILEGESLTEAPAPTYGETLGSTPSYNELLVTPGNEKRGRRSSIDSVEGLGRQHNGKKRCHRSDVEPAESLGSDFHSTEFASNRSGQPSWDVLGKYLVACLGAVREGNVGFSGITMPSGKLDQLSEIDGRMSGKLDQLSEMDGRISGKLDQLSEMDGRMSGKLDQLSEMDGRISGKLDQLSEMEVHIQDRLQRIGGELEEREVFLRNLWDETRRAMDFTNGKVEELRQGVNRDLADIANRLEAVYGDMGMVAGRELTQIARDAAEALMSRFAR